MATQERSPAAARSAHWRQDMTRHTRWLFRIPEPNNAQVGVVIGKRSEQRMHELWSRGSAHVATKAQRDYIVRRVTDDPSWHSHAAWKIEAIKVRAFRRVLTSLWRREIETHDDPLSRYAEWNPLRDFHPLRDVFNGLLRRLKLHYADIADALDKEADILTDKCGCHVIPPAHRQRVWFDQVMGIDND